MSDPNMLTLWVPIVGALSAIGGSVATGLIAYLINQSNKRSEEKKHLVTLMFGAAMEDWKKRLLMAVRNGVKSNVDP